MDDDDIARILRRRRGSRGNLDALGGDHFATGSERSDSESDTGKSALVEALLLLMGLDGLSIPNVNWLARGCEEDIENGFDGRRLNDLKKLANIGGHGAYPGNMRRDVMRAFATNDSLPQPLQTEVVCLNALKDEILCPQPRL